MMTLPGALGSNEIIGWRLDRSDFARTWDSGEGAYRFGGRWNSKGRRVVYASLDPSTSILEVAVHKTFKALDTVPHILTAFIVADPSEIHVVQSADVPNTNWLRPNIPSAGQQAHGDNLLETHTFVVLPSAVSTHSWNIIFDPVKAVGRYSQTLQEAFALDTRLHPPA